MHCVEPACASVCPVGALQKTALGPVVYDPEKCFGCRYCVQACAFQVPSYEWNQRLPRMRKCDMCFEKQRRGEPTACAAACPTGTPHCINFGSKPRQILVAPKCRIVCRSVVTLGTVQLRITRSPLRTARRSEGGFGNSNDGGRGNPIVAHAVNTIGALKANRRENVDRLMRRNRLPEGP